MKNLLKAFILVFTLTSIVVFAQQQQSNSDQMKSIKIKPVFTYDEMAFSYKLLNGIEISGSESDMFLTVRNSFAIVIKAAGNTKKGSDNDIVEMDLQTAQNFINLMGRAKITGAQADMYKRIQTAIADAATALKASGK